MEEIRLKKPMPSQNVNESVSKIDKNVDQIIAREKRHDLFQSIKIIQAVNKNPLPRKLPFEKCSPPPETYVSGRVLLQCFDSSDESVQVCLDVEGSEFLGTKLKDLSVGSEFNSDDIKCYVLVK